MAVVFLLVVLTLLSGARCLWPSDWFHGDVAKTHYAKVHHECMECGAFLSPYFARNGSLLYDRRTVSRLCSEPEFQCAKKCEGSSAHNNIFHICNDIDGFFAIFDCNKGDINDFADKLTVCFKNLPFELESCTRTRMMFECGEYMLRTLCPPTAVAYVQKEITYYKHSNPKCFDS